MYFCLALVEYWESIGFDTTDWRKNHDKTKAIVHERYAKALVDLVGNTEVKNLLCSSTEFEELINSEDWKVEQVI